MAALVLTLGLIRAPEARADSLESAVMPGPVVEGHAKFEEKCSSCHSAFDKKERPKLCRSCHKEIDADILGKRGFHGMEPKAASEPCTTCHTEHKGRQGRITFFNEETFNHDFTNFPLKGGHEQVNCSACHKPGAKRRDTPTDCISCHKADDRHQGDFGDKCQSCHTPDLWSKLTFDHSTTDFTLLGKHKDVACNFCHVTKKFDDAPKTCIGCHKINDVHKGLNGTDCAKCHSAESWKTSRFDHKKETGFDLLGRHEDLTCAACHGQALSVKKPPKTCSGCHVSDDVHKGEFGTKCSDCHSTRQWSKANFNHNRDTKFPLSGEHSNAPCAACHSVGAAKAPLPLECNGCHKNDDPHKGALGSECQNCHTPKSFVDDVKFDHDLTRFPLIGLHAVVSCESCHTTQTFKDATAACQDCHKADDPHKRSLGDDCSTCHSANGWDFWIFDHNKNTRFNQEGAHEGLECAACHHGKLGSRGNRNQTCDTCHREDDVHHGRFGRQCDTCHTTTDFKTIRMGQ